MAAAKQNFLVEQGSTFIANLIWKDSNDVPIDLTGYTARMQIREKIDDEAYIFEATSASGITITPLTGEIAIRIEAADTALFTITKGVYDLELEDSGGTVTRLLYGSITVSKEVTR